jgi:predicted ribosomally synthesized peptide with SipW-like signal peptide
LLAGLGAIGAGAALGGAGTTALFSDGETFTGNEVVAGELDLAVDWEEHYNGEMVDREPPQPLLSRQEIAAQWDLDRERHDDRIDRLYRDQFRDVPQQLEAPVIDLEDVKPGDSGEVTFSLHPFGMPVSLSFTGELLASRENGVTEPEQADPDEDDTAGSNDDGDGSNGVPLSAASFPTPSARRPGTTPTATTASATERSSSPAARSTRCSTSLLRVSGSTPVSIPSPLPRTPPTGQAET